MSTHRYTTVNITNRTMVRAILLVVAAVVYFVNPIDLLPDLIPVAGLTDDFGILLWVYNSLHTEIDKFILWEKSRINA